MNKLQNAKRIQFTVVKHYPFGLMVELEDGRSAIIRAREISWDRAERNNWRQLCPVGWTSWAVPIETDGGDRLQLSLRLAQSDPWEKLPAAVKTGNIVPGIVTGVVGYGAFVELAIGLTGLLHYTQLPAGLKKSPMEVFWPGDSVRVKILNVDRARRRISLGLPPYRPPALDHRSPAPAPVSAEAPPPDASPASSGGPDQLIVDHFLKHKSTRRHILIVEDEAAEARSLSFWFRSLQQSVDSVGNGEKALELLEKTQPDIALIDAGLPEKNGLEVARAIRDHWPQVKVILTAELDEDASLKEVDELQALGIHTLIKPFTPEDLIDHLIEPENRLKPAATNLAGGFDALELRNLAVKSSLSALLEQCLHWTGFETALLFQLDDLNHRIRLVHGCGAGALDDRLFPNLIYSPVRDVAEDEQTIFLESLTDEDYGRFRYLLEVYPLSACIGVPVPSALVGNHALFLLDSRTQTLRRETLTFAQAAALVAGNLLENNALQDRMRIIQGIAIRGQVASSLAHEINSSLIRLSDYVNDVEALLKEIEKPHPDHDVAETAVEARARLLEMRRELSEASSTANLFGSLDKQKREIIRVDEILKKAQMLLLETSYRTQIRIHLTLPEKLLLIRSHSISLLHIVLNLLLNAVQQITELRGAGGSIHIRLVASCGSGATDHFKILIEDDGPGIHASLWEKVFEPGFTTRADGSGLGLFISRNLVESMGGRLYVQESYILGGTIFCVELPCEF